MVIVGQSFYPSIAGLHRKTARKAFRCEHFIPIGFTIGLAILQEERTIAKQFAAIGTGKAFRMEMFTDRIQTITLRAR